MRFACFLLIAASLSSCNTTIGFGRDVKEGYHWSKNKIQENRGQGGGSGGYQDDYGAPVY